MCTQKRMNGLSRTVLSPICYPSQDDYFYYCHFYTKCIKDIIFDAKHTEKNISILHHQVLDKEFIHYTKTIQKKAVDISSINLLTYWDKERVQFSVGDHPLNTFYSIYQDDKPILSFEDFLCSMRPILIQSATPSVKFYDRISSYNTISSSLCETPQMNYLSTLYNPISHLLSSLSIVVSPLLLHQRAQSISMTYYCPISIDHVSGTLQISMIGTPFLRYFDHYLYSVNGTPSILQDFHKETSSFIGTTLPYTLQTACVERLPYINLQEYDIAHYDSQYFDLALSDHSSSILNNSVKKMVYQDRHPSNNQDSIIFKIPLSLPSVTMNFLTNFQAQMTKPSKLTVPIITSDCLFQHTISSNTIKLNDYQYLSNIASPNTSFPSFIYNPSESFIFQLPFFFITEEIFSFLDFRDLCRLGFVHSRFLKWLTGCPITMNTSTECNHYQPQLCYKIRQSCIKQHSLAVSPNDCSNDITLQNDCQLTMPSTYLSYSILGNYKSNDSDWELWNHSTFQLREQNTYILDPHHSKTLSPTRFMNRPLSFYDAKRSYKTSDNNTTQSDCCTRSSFRCHHIILGKWWEYLTHEEDHTLTQLLATSGLRTLIVDPTFYECMCKICQSIYHQDILNVQPNLKEPLSEFPNANLSLVQEEQSMTLTNNLLLDSHQIQQHIPISNNETLIHNILDRTDNPLTFSNVYDNTLNTTLVNEQYDSISRHSSRNSNIMLDGSLNEDIENYSLLNNHYLNPHFIYSRTESVHCTSQQTGNSPMTGPSSLSASSFRSLPSTPTIRFSSNRQSQSPSLLCLPPLYHSPRLHNYSQTHFLQQTFHESVNEAFNRDIQYHDPFDQTIPSRQSEEPLFERIPDISSISDLSHHLTDLSPHSLVSLQHDNLDQRIHQSTMLSPNIRSSCLIEHDELSTPRLSLPFLNVHNRYFTPNQSSFDSGNSQLQDSEDNNGSEAQRLEIEELFNMTTFNIQETSDNLHHFDNIKRKYIAKRHACGRFFWVLRMMFMCRDTLETVDFGNIPNIVQTMCDDGQTVPDLPLDLRSLSHHFSFPKLKKLRFGETVDCRFIVPLLDFCHYPILQDVEILGLSLRYETLKSQFGKEPTMVFGPQQLFTAHTSTLPDGTPAPLWLPAVYNGGVDDILQLQGHGVYVSREYRYEGYFKNGRNDGWGKMISKCGEIYQGYWKEGRRHGLGFVVQADGKRLEGEWIRDVLHGRGAMEIPNGLRYEGEWLNGALDGWGILSKNKQLLAIGQFCDGKPFGWMRCRLNYSHVTGTSYPSFETHKKSTDIKYFSLVTDDKYIYKAHQILPTTTYKDTNGTFNTVTHQTIDPEFHLNNYNQTNDFSALSTNGNSDIHNIHKNDSNHDEPTNDEDSVPFNYLKDIDILFEPDSIQFITPFKILDLNQNMNFNTMLYEMTTTHSHNESAISTESKLTEIFTTPGWKDIWRFPSINLIENHTLEFLKNPPISQEVLLLNPLLLQQVPGLGNHNESRKRRMFDPMRLPLIPEWVERIVDHLNIV